MLGVSILCGRIDTILLVFAGLLQVSCVNFGKSPSLFSSNMTSVFGEITTQLEGARRVDITSNPINISQSQSALKQNVEDKLLALDTIGSRSGVINYV